MFLGSSTGHGEGWENLLSENDPTWVFNCGDNLNVFVFGENFTRELDQPLADKVGQGNGNLLFGSPKERNIRTTRVDGGSTLPTAIKIQFEPTSSKNRFYLRYRQFSETKLYSNPSGNQPNRNWQQTPPRSIRN